MSQQQFDPRPEVYDSLVNWDRRLANEGPFYQDLFERIGARKILDTACGTGHHAALFHSWGKTVEAADASPDMIAFARGCHGESTNLKWVVRGFCQPVHAAASFDVALCVGNSLALAGDRAAMETAVTNLFSSIRSGGAVVIHLLNLWRLPDGPCIVQKSALREMDGRRVIIVKGVHRAGARGFVDLLMLPVDGAGQPQVQSVPFLGLCAEELSSIANRCGVQSITFFGGYQKQPYVREESVDLILVAEKA